MRWLPLCIPLQFNLLQFGQGFAGFGVAGIDLQHLLELLDGSRNIPRLGQCHGKIIARGKGLRIDLDDILRERAANLKSERERAKAALDRVRSQCGRAISIDAEKIDVFARLMIDKLENGDVNGRKAYIRAVISAIEVGDKTVRIIGCKDVLQAVIAGKQTANENVRGFIRKWRARRDSNSCPLDS